MIEPESHLVNKTRFLRKSVSIPIELYKSTIGSYFIGSADNLLFGRGASAWARLYNPPDSGVTLHVNVWTAAALSSPPSARVPPGIGLQVWFNAEPPGTPEELSAITPTNTALKPPPTPRIKLQQASGVTGEPTGGVKAFTRQGHTGETLVEVENGKLIFPPGGSFLVMISYSDNSGTPAAARIAFGWWEDRILGSPDD
jgi:hypothetical protein